jgi:hypothetical protein
VHRYQTTSSSIQRQRSASSAQAQSAAPSIVRNAGSLRRLGTVVLAVAGSLTVSAAVANAYVSRPAAFTGGVSPTLSIDHINTAVRVSPGTSSIVRLDITNHATQPQYVRFVHLDGITADAAHAACSVRASGAHPAFTMRDIPVSATLASGSTTSRTGSLTMNDTGVNQNACQQATLTLRFSSR